MPLIEKLGEALIWQMLKQLLGSLHMQQDQNMQALQTAQSQLQAADQQIKTLQAQVTDLEDKLRAAYAQLPKTETTISHDREN